VNFEYNPTQSDYDNDIDYNCTFSVVSDDWGDYLGYKFDSWQPISMCKGYHNCECGNGVYIGNIYTDDSILFEHYCWYQRPIRWMLRYPRLNITVRITRPEHTEIRMKFYTQLEGEKCESDEFRCDHGCLHRSLACGQDGESYCPAFYKNCKLVEIAIIVAAIVAFLILVVVILIYTRGRKLNNQACCLSSTRRSTHTSENAMTISATQLASEVASATSNENTENQIPSLAFPPSEYGSVADTDADERHDGPQCDLPPSYDEAVRKGVQ